MFWQKNKKMPKHILKNKRNMIKSYQMGIIPEKEVYEMWYAEVVDKMKQNKSYSRQQIFELLRESRPNTSKSSFDWIIYSMVKDGLLTRIERNTYEITSKDTMEKSYYEPTFNDKSLEIISKIQGKYPYIDFTCFESVQLNEFLNHLIARNTFFVMVEKDVLEFIFRFLREEYSDVLLRPSNSDWDSYWKPDCIVVLNQVTESPQNEKKERAMSIEKMLVDIIAEKTFENLYSKSELKRIYETAYQRYIIDKTKMLRYARRRNKEKIVKEYLGGLSAN